MRTPISTPAAARCHPPNAGVLTALLIAAAAALGLLAAASVALLPATPAQAQASETPASVSGASEALASETGVSEARASEVRASEARASDARASEAQASEAQASETLDPGIEGIWEGALALPQGQSLRLVVHIERGDDGSLSGRLDSPQQGAMGIPIDRVSFDDEGRLVLELPGIGARYEGSLEEPDHLVGTWSQGGGSLPLELRRGDGAAAAAPARPQEPRAPFPYLEEDVRFENAGAGIRLAGTLTIPEGPGPFPAVALVTGSGPQDRDEAIAGHRPFLVLADHLTRSGIAVLRYDDRGFGESEGDFGTATTRDFAEDAAAALDFLRTRPEVDRGATGLIGHSEGGLVAYMVAAGAGGADFIVSLAGTGLPGEEILYLQGALVSRAMGVPEEVIEGSLATQRRIFAVVRAEDDPERRRERVERILRQTIEETPAEQLAAAGVPPGSEEPWIQGQLAAITSPWFRFFLTHDPRDDLRRVRVPVLALIGEKDLQVPPAENLSEIRRALAEAGNEDVTALELPGLNHLFQTAGTGAPSEYAQIEETFAPAAMEFVAGWIGERFGRGGSR